MLIITFWEMNQSGKGEEYQLQSIRLVHSLILVFILAMEQVGQESSYKTEESPRIYLQTRHRTKDPLKVGKV